MSTSNLLKIPGPIGLPLSGNLYRLRRDILTRLLSDHNKFGDIFKYRVGAIRYIILSKPEYIRHVLNEYKDNYSKDTLSNEEIRHITGDSLLTLHGEAWHEQRRRMQGAFRKGAVSTYLAEMKNETNKIMQLWHNRADHLVPVAQDMSALTYGIVGKALLGTDMQQSSSLIYDALDTALLYISARIQSLIRLPLWGLTPRQRHFKDAIKQFDSIVNEIITQRLSDKSIQGDLVAKLITAVDDTGSSQSPMTRQQVRNELITLLLAGHETTANLMTWCLYELSKRPDLQDALFAEVKDLNLDSIDVNQLHNLQLHFQTIQEALRLYPPVWMMERGALQDDVMGNYKIKRNTTVIISSWIMHRHPRYWDKPNEFNPDHFAPSRIQELPDYVFIPFGKGPRMCIGMNFAVQESLIMLATIVQNFRFVNASTEPVAPIPSITLRPPKDITIRVTPRQ